MRVGYAQPAIAPDGTCCALNVRFWLMARAALLIAGCGVRPSRCAGLRPDSALLACRCAGKVPVAMTVLGQGLGQGLAEVGD
jgi:hypothetical protein